MKKLNAMVDALSEGKWAVRVVDVDTEDYTDMIIEAETDKEAAFKAMEQFNDKQ
jgi:3,4-dihydroxy-2-butanone 4-phosphate synthase